MKNKWYVANTCTHNGLVVEEKSGENIAVTYKKENAPLVACAPELLACLKNLIERDLIKDTFNDHYSEVIEIITKAEGKTQ